MDGHIANDFLEALSCFEQTDADAATLAEPADVRIAELAEQAYRFLDAVGAAHTATDADTHDITELPIAA